MNNPFPNWASRLLPYLMLAVACCKPYSLPKSSPKPDLVGTAWKRLSNKPENGSQSQKTLADSLSPTFSESGSAKQNLPKTWWTIFKDNRLDSLENEALKNNRNLKLALFRMEESRANVGVLRSNLFPQISFDPNFTRQHYSGNRPSPISTINNLAAFTTSQYTLPFDATYEVDIWGKFKSGIAASDATRESAVLDKEVILLSLSADLAVNYFTIRQLDRQYRVYAKALQTRQQGLEINKSLFKAGLISEQDVTQAEIERYNVELAMLDAHRNRATAENNLSELCGIPASKFALPPDTQWPALPKIPLSVPAEQLRNRPDVAQALMNVNAAEFQKQVACKTFKPTLKLNATYGMLSARPARFFGDDSGFTGINQNSLSWLFSGTFSIPVFTGGRKTASILAAEAKVNQAGNQYEAQLLKASREVQEAINQLHYRSGQIEMQKKVLASARRNAALAREQFAKGLNNYLNVVIADRSALDAENNLVLAQGQQIVASIFLIKATGGGWQVGD